MSATLDELAQHGLEGMNIPRIAEVAEVNKTTIYRRWPTREALVAAALEASLHEIAGELIDTGSLRGDLGRLLGAIAARLDSPTGRALARAALSEHATAVVSSLARDPVAREQQSVRELIARAIQRGEWDPKHEPEAVLAMIAGGVMHRVLMERQPATTEWIDTIAHVVARGVAPEAAPG